MNSAAISFDELYKNFNARNVDLVISKMTDDVKWANGMEGGYVCGHQSVKEYWMRQFTMVNSQVTPITIAMELEVSKVLVHQVVHDMQGTLLADELVYHFFHLKNNKIAEFHIGEKVKNDIDSTDPAQI